MIEECPLGAETLVARIVHLLTERSAPTVDLVARVKQLHEKRHTDVRSLIPVLTGLDKTDLLKALPKFVLSAANQRAVSNVFRRILTGKHIETGHAPMNPAELMIELHKLDTMNDEEQKLLITNMDVLFGYRALYTKEVHATVLETLLEEPEVPPLTMRTLSKAVGVYPALNGFAINLLQRLLLRSVWQQESIWPGFVKICNQLRPNSLQVLLLHLPAEQWTNAVEMARSEGEDLLASVRVHLKSLSGHQQVHIPSYTLSLINSMATVSEQMEETVNDENRPD